jgi:hypothetical protein
MEGKKKIWGKKCPRYFRAPQNNKYIYGIMCQVWKIVTGNLIYDIKWGARTLGSFSPNIFSYF